MKKILIIEDDAAVLKGLVESLKLQHYEVLSELDGDDGYKRAMKEKVDLIILDLMLPGKDGLEICKDLRRSKFESPILMLTSKKEEIDKVLGLEIGADDYMTKPFSLRELHARIKALLRRSKQIESEINEAAFGKVSIDFTKHEALRNNKPLNLSALEFKIIKYFLQHEGEVVSREMLLDNVWGFENYPTTRTVDNFILSIRKQIEDNPTKPKHLITVYKAGYKFVR